MGNMVYPYVTKGRNIMIIYQLGGDNIPSCHIGSQGVFIYCKRAHNISMYRNRALIYILVSKPASNATNHGRNEGR